MRYFAILGAWHVHADGYARELSAIEGCALKAVWDKDREKADAWAEKLGCESMTLDGIMEDEAIEGVLICTATSEHTDVILRAINAGKAVFTEKVLALTNEDCERIARAVRRNNTRFAISFPHFSFATVRYALAAVRAGELGQMNYARVRNVHDGAIRNWLPAHFYDAAQCGGGAMMDLGAHPMYLLCAFLGEPESVVSAFTRVTGKPVEDNAVSLLKYADGAIGVSETGFVSNGYPYMIELGGDRGTMLLDRKTVRMNSDSTGHEWREVCPGDNAPQPLEVWARFEEDIPAEYGIDAAVRLTRVMTMAYRNA